MPFPEAPRVIYRKNPLNRVICQLRYPSILKINTESPADFQESIRREYPLYREKTEFLQENTIRGKTDLPTEMMNQLMQASVTKNHEFRSEDGIWKINLTRNFLSISTSKYVRWEDFLERFMSSYKALMRIYMPPFFLRIGLRYVDIFERSALSLQDSPWTELLQPYFLGMLSSEISDRVKMCENSYEISLADNESLVRINTSFVQNVENNEQCYMIDSDFYAARKTQPDKTFNKLDFLHQRATRLIRFIITDKLHAAMEPQEI